MKIKTQDLKGPYKGELTLSGTYPIVLLPANCALGNLQKLLVTWSIKEVDSEVDVPKPAPVVENKKPAQKPLTMKDTESVDLADFL